MAKITGIKVGTTTITASYGGKSSSVSNFRVTAIAPVLEYNSSVADNTTYDGTNKCLGGMVYTGDGIGYYYVSTSSTVPAANASGWVRADGQTSPHEDYKIYNGTGATGAGTYYIFFKSTAGTNYTAVNPKLVGNITISKRSVSVTAPSFVSTTLTYNGSNQNLTTGGSANPAVGTMYYYASTSSDTPTFNASTWTTSAAKALNAGTYNVWYYYQADSSNNSGSDINAVKKLSGTKVINQKEVTLSWGTSSWVYDGNTHSTTCTAGSLISGDTCNVTLTGNSVGKNVGSATVTASGLSNSNYKLPSTTTKSISVTAKTVVLEWGTKSWVYNGSAHGTTCSVKSTSLVGSDTCTVTLSGNSITYVGSTTVTATGLSNSNYALPTAAADKQTTISVTKANPTITVTGVSTEYTGNKIYAKLTNTNIKGTIYWRTGSAPTTSTYTGKKDITSTGSMSVDLGYVQYVSENHTMYWLFVPSSTANSLSSGHTYAQNYNNGSNSVAMTLTKKAITIPTISAVEVTYDRAAHSLTFPAVDGASITKYQTSTNGSTWTDASPATTNPSLTNAGTLYVRAYYTADGNHSGSGYTTGKTIKINQKEIGLSWGTRTWTYDGSTHSTTCSATGVITGDTCNVTLTGNSVGKNVGSATVTASSLSNSNYKLPSTKTTTISITQREVTLTWGTTSWPYDGTAKSTTCTAGNLVTGDTCTVTLTGNSITNVGSTTVTASELSNDNYKLPSTKTATLTITSGTLTVTATPYSGTYDGTAHNGITAISAKNQAGTTVSPTFTYCATESGTYSSTIPTVKNVTTGTKIYYKATLTGYTTATGYATAVVTAKTATLKFANLTHTYDATSHTATCSVSNLESGDTCTVTLNNASRTNQGTQTVTATALSNSNYVLPTSKTATLTINKRPINVTAASDTKVYDGTALTNSNATAEATNTSENRGLANTNHSMTSCTVTGSQTTVGTSNNVPSAAVIKSGSTDVTDNYNITYVNGTLKVTARTVSVTAPAFVTGNLEYDGSNKTVASGGSCGTGGTMYYYISTTNSTPTFSTSTWSTAQNIQAKNAGTYYVWYYCKVDDTTNNTGSGLNTVTKVTGSKEIAKRTVSLTWGTASWIYDGNTKTTTCTAGNLVSGDSCTVNLTGNSVGPHVGSATVTASSLSNSNYKLPSSGTTKSISITQKEVTLTWGTLSWVYTGSSHSTTCTAGNLVSGDTCTVTLTGNSVGPNVGTATVTATGLENANDDYKLPTSGLTQTLRITAPTTTLTFNVNSASLVYNGAAQTLGTVSYNGDGQAKYYVSTSNTTPGSGVTWTNISNGGEVKMTNAGTYYVFLQSTAGTNYPAVSVKLGNSTGKAIAQRPINITASSKSQAYNGSALTSNSATAEATGTNRGLASEHSMTSYTVTGSQTYFGSSSNVPSAAVIKSGTTDVTSNYAITYVNGTLTITKATPVVSITGVTENYTGGQFWATATVNAKGTLYWKKGSAPTTSSNDGSVPITAINTATNITSVKDNSDDFEMYWLFVPSSTANSLTSGHTYAENFTNAGGTSNDHKSLTINPRSISNVSASANAVTYNGSQQTASVSITDAGGNLTSNDYTISGNTGTNATSYTITITGRNNYTGTKTITWTINKRPVTITADSASKVYDGTALTKNSVTAAAQNNTNNTGMISSHHVHSWTVSGSQTLAGSSNNTVTAATIYTGASSTHGGSSDTTNVTSNYAITYAVGTLTVTKRAVTATATNQTKVYDGTKLTAANTGTVTNLPSNHTITYTCTGEIGPGVSTGTKTLSSVVIKNSGGTDITSSCFTVTKNNGTLSITKAALTYSNVSSVSEYCTASATARSTTDSAKTLEIATASASGVAGTSDTITYSTSQSGWSVSSDGLTLTVPANANAGTYNITVTASSANYDPVTNSVKVVINPVVLSTLALELRANTVAYGSSTTVASLIATYSNGAFKDVKDDADTTYSATKDSANDDIVSITKE
jgi:hypothetical protein